MQFHYKKDIYENTIVKSTVLFILLILSIFNTHASALQQNPCSLPVTITTNSIGTTHALVEWSASALPANGFEWEVRSSGNPGSGTTGLVQSGSTARTTLAVLNLAPDTVYSLAVRSACQEAVFSEWTIITIHTNMNITNQTGQIGYGTQNALSLYGPILYITPTIRKGSVSDMLFTAAELETMGIPENATITGVAFKKLTNATGVGYTPVKMKILAANSTTTSPLGNTITLQNIETTHTAVLDNDAFVLDGTIGWIDFNFETPFEYTGQNLELATAMFHTPLNNNANTSHFSTFVSWEYTAGFQDYVTGAWLLPTVDVNNSATVVLNHSSGVQYKERPNIQIHYQVNAVVAGVAVNTTAGLAPEITQNQGSLQLAALVNPSTASQDVIWEIVSGAEYASIDNNGLLSAYVDGTVIVRARAMDNTIIFDDITIAISNQTHCTVAFPQLTEPITSVQFAEINNTSSAAFGTTPAYEDFTAVITEVTQGQSYTLTVKGNTVGNSTHYITAYFDWNRNNSFEDAGESYTVGTIQNSTGLDNISATASINIPANAPVGNTRMRIIKKLNTVATSCNSSGYGQAEDYTLHINEINMGIGNPGVNAISVYPNPFIDSISITTPESVVSVEAFNYLGQSVGKTNGSTINLSFLSGGIYLLKVNFENGKSAATKVIKK